MPYRAIPSHRHASVKTDEYLYSQLIPYIGNKRKLLPLIARAIASTGASPVSPQPFVDLFAGSGVVSRLAKKIGYHVIANDWEPYAFAINNCFIGCGHAPEFKSLGGAQFAVDHLNGLPPQPGYIATHFCPADDDNPDIDRERMFFTCKNGAKIDAIREQIALWEADGMIDSQERSYLIAPLLFAVSYVSNTSGVFKGFHKGWGGQTKTALYRILSDLSLRTPILTQYGSGDVWQMDAQLAAERLRGDGRRPQVVYLDPPYNQHPYGSNYHLLNTVALWDKPAVDATIGSRNKSAIRTDWRTERRSAYNYAGTATAALDKLLTTIDARHVMLSYSTDGIIPLREVIRAAAERGRLTCVHESYKRYRVSSQRMSKKPVNLEFILIIDCDATSTPSNADAIYDTIILAESTALARHPKAPESG